MKKKNYKNSKRNSRQKSVRLQNIQLRKIVKDGMLDTGRQTKPKNNLYSDSVRLLQHEATIREGGKPAKVVFTYRPEACCMSSIYVPYLCMHTPT
jgi:hypothetical protein